MEQTMSSGRLFQSLGPAEARIVSDRLINAGCCCMRGPFHDSQTCISLVKVGTGRYGSSWSCLDTRYWVGENALWSVSSAVDQRQTRPEAAQRSSIIDVGNYWDRSHAIPASAAAAAAAARDVRVRINGARISLFPLRRPIFSASVWKPNLFAI